MCFEKYLKDVKLKNLDFNAQGIAQIVYSIYMLLLDYESHAFSLRVQCTCTNSGTGKV